MNFAGGLWWWRFAPCLVLALLCIQGCGDGLSESTVEELHDFNRAGPLAPQVDVDRLVGARTAGGPYRVVPGDLLEIQIPTVLHPLPASWNAPVRASLPHLCRVQADGAVTIPVVEPIAVIGHSTSSVAGGTSPVICCACPSSAA